jgi:hypothetical protein
MTKTKAEKKNIEFLKTLRGFAPEANNLKQILLLTFIRIRRYRM